MPLNCLPLDALPQDYHLCHLLDQKHLCETSTALSGLGKSSVANGSHRNFLRSAGSSFLPHFPAKLRSFACLCCRRTRSHGGRRQTRRQLLPPAAETCCQAAGRPLLTAAPAADPPTHRLAVSPLCMSEIFITSVAPPLVNRHSRNFNRNLLLPAVMRGS